MFKKILEILIGMDFYLEWFIIMIIISSTWLRWVPYLEM